MSEPKNRRVVVRLTESLAHDLALAMKTSGQSASEILRRALGKTLRAETDLDWKRRPKKIRIARGA